jgi:hypothetical protein
MSDPISVTAGTQFIQNSILWYAEIVSSDGNITVIDGSAGTSKLEFSSSIYSLFTYGEWDVKLDSDLFEKQILAVGTKIIFHFAPTNTLPIEITMCVLSIQIASDLDSKHIGRSFGLVLVSPWYFDQVSNSHAYKGSTSGIIRQVINEELSSSFTNSQDIVLDLNRLSIQKSALAASISLSTTKANLIETSDYNQAKRYRTEMTPSKFFETRLRKYLRGTDKTSVFMYVNQNHEFEILDYPAMNKLTTFICIDYSHPHLSGFKSIIENTPERIIYPAHSYFLLNNSKDRDLWALANPALLYMFRVDGQVKRADDDPILKFLTANFEKRFINVRTNVVPSLQTKTYLDDSFRFYEDIQSEVLSDYTKRLMDNQAMGVICSPNLSVQIGRFCDMYLTTPDDSQASLLFQKYIITEVSHVFRGFIGQTTLTLASPAFGYGADGVVTEDQISELWHPQ